MIDDDNVDITRFRDIEPPSFWTTEHEVRAWTILAFSFVVMGSFFILTLMVS